MRLRAPPAAAVPSAPPRSRSSRRPPRTSVMRSSTTTGTSWRSRRRRWSRSACSPSRVASRSRLDDDRSSESESSCWRRSSSCRSRSRASPTAPSAARPARSSPVTSTRRSTRRSGRTASTRCRPIRSSRRLASPSVSAFRCERSGAYIRAVELQPDNPLTWYTLGIFEFEVRENLCAAYRFLNNSYTLDPAGNQWLKGGPLDIARDAVNEGGCAPGS